MHNMNDDISEIFFSAEELEAIVDRLGRQISADYANKQLLLVCVLKGSVMFMSDLMKHITIPVNIEFMATSSYGNNTKASGQVKITRDIGMDITGKNVIIVEDILDSGHTLSMLIQYLQIKNPASVEICTLLDKPDRRVADVKAKYVGSTVKDEFVVGYGLDYCEKYRNLPYIGILSADAAKRTKEETEEGI